jgi:ssRNA-specific RNase YbeY (16S rRNA maturation enzyme)
VVNIQNELPFSQEQLLQDAVECTLRLHDTVGDVNILIVDLERMRELNRSFRGIDAPTDVLTFPADTGDTMFAQEPAF